jgi:hypothetical protein
MSGKSRTLAEKIGLEQGGVEKCRSQFRQCQRLVTVGQDRLRPEALFKKRAPRWGIVSAAAG